jgi:hypothetical protein
VDLIAVRADPGISPGLLAQRIRAAGPPGAGYTIATGATRGALANPGLAIERANGQVRRAVLAEQALLAVAGGVLGYLPGSVLGALGVRALAAHGTLPAGSGAPAGPGLAVIVCLINLPVCVISGLGVPGRSGDLRRPAGSRA